MAHLALYREFRPQRFADVVGQQHITRTLKNAVMYGRLHHAYLLSGPRGTGKTTVARILGKAVNCLAPQQGEPCNECEACKSISSGETMDIIEIDAASNRGIDEIRDLREKVKYAPAELQRKVYIIDEVHMLSEPAFNALLKTLEEPPAHVLFVLATTEKQKLPVTIISRCQCFEYHRLSSQEIIGRLQEVGRHYGLSVAPEALTAIARQAEGGMRDALSLLDQVMAFAVEGRISLEETLHVLGSAPLESFLKIDDSLLTGDVGGVLLALDELVRQGKDLRQLVRDFLVHLRDLLLLKVDATGSALDLPAASVESIAERSGQLEQAQVLAAIRLFAQLESDLRYSSSPRLLVEVGLIRVAGLFSGQGAGEVHQGPAAPAPERAAEPEAKPVLEAKPGRQAEAVPQAPPTNREGPSPSAAPFEPASPVRTGGPLDEVLEKWDEVVELVSRYRSTSMLLGQAKVTRLRGKTVILAAANKAFADLLKRPQDKSIIEKAMAKVGLEGYDVQPVPPEDPLARPEAGGAAAAEAQPASGGARLTDIARRVFPSDLVEEVDEEGSS